MNADPHRIVVGYDGSRGAHRALEFALANRQQNSQVTLLCAYRSLADFTSTAAYAGSANVDAVQPELRAEATLRDGLRIAHLLDPAAEVLCSVAQGATAAVLADASKTSSLVVIGSRQLHGFGSFLLGSVGWRLTSSAHCPVVVVRGEAPIDAHHGCVVAGIKEDPTSKDVLAHAFEYASAHRAPLRVIHCHLPRYPMTEDQLGTEDADPGAKSRLAEVLAGWGEKYPDVTVDAAVIVDFTSDGLLDQAEGQRILVVGSGASRSPARTIIGSTTQSALHHASLPVMVVPPSDQEAREPAR